MSAIPAAWRSLVDDAATFPPGDAALADAVATHLARRSAWDADLVGGLVVRDRDLPELAGLLGSVPAETGLDVNVVVTGGAGSLEPAAAWADRIHGARLRALEVALRDLDDPAGAARRVVTALEVMDLPDEVDVYVEVPPNPSPGLWAALDVLAEREIRLKLRTGGLTADDFPRPEVLGGAIDATLDRELPFKCTAGLHRAVAHTDPVTGFAHHGFLNVLLAVEASLAGSDPVDALAERSTEAVATCVRELDVPRARRWFPCFGSCSVEEPRDDLVDLGLVDVPEPKESS